MKRVVIAGAGPVGLLAAILLAQRGVGSLVLERRPEPYPLPRAVHLDDEAVRTLQEAGLAQQFAAISRPALGLRVLDAQHRVLAQFDRSPLPGPLGHPAANLFDQPALEDLLRARAAQFGCIEIRSGWTVIGVDQQPGSVRVIAATPDQDAHELLAPALLGCDGAGSTVRQLIGSPMRDLRFRERWLVVDARSTRDLGSWDGVHQICDPARAATYMQVGPDRYRWEFRLLDGETALQLGSSDSLDQLLRPWTGPAGLDGIEVIRSVEYTFWAQIAARWRSGRVFLLGDAAHQTPPFIGQGLGSGLRDVANLTWKLAAVLTDGADESLLDTYPEERIPHAEAMIRLARRLGWAMTGGQDAAAVVRRIGLAVAMRVPGVNQALDRGSPRLRHGSLVGPGRLAGALIPQPLIGGSRLDDLLGPGFAVVAVGPISAQLQHLADQLKARIVVLQADSSLASWLRRGGAQAVVIRPDRVVMASTGRCGQLSHASIQTMTRLSSHGAQQG